jgi:hypothetical protein
MTYEEALRLRAGDVFVYDNPNFSWQPPRTYMIIEVIEDKGGVSSFACGVTRAR